jgi:hypothetical protein
LLLLPPPCAALRVPPLLLRTQGAPPTCKACQTAARNSQPASIIFICQHHQYLVAWFSSPIKPYFLPTQHQGISQHAMRLAYNAMC